MTNSKDTADRVIAFIDNAPFPPSTRYIKERLDISDGQFFNAKPYLTGYKMVALHWHPLAKAATAKALHTAQRRVLITAYNRAYAEKRKHAHEGALSA